MNSRINSYISHILFGLIFLLPLPAFAQSETATVLGTVRDANGAAVTGATVTLKNIGTSISATTTTDASGDYIFSNTRIGNYQITIEASGFNRTVADNINLVINARQRVDIELQVASATETVMVTG